ncbi:MAG: AIR synthase family protein [Euryarchaeota archaeon]|nr:AIR synthase family protein [Euryarchaeota archaeon]
MKGKIDPARLNDLVFPFLGVKSDTVLIGPKTGEDAAVLDLGELHIVVSSDPITGAKDSIGWYSVNVNANDIATMGAVPRYFLPVIMLNESSTEEDLKKIMEDIDNACKELNISVIGGHSEVTPNLKETIISASIIGIIKKNNKVLSSSGAKAGDRIVLTKGAGIEGTSILAHDFSDLLVEKVDGVLLERAKIYMSSLSVVKEALIARNYATAMHDPTEGGVLGGIHELCDASEKGFSVDISKIITNEETKVICEALEVDPLALIGSGALLITCPEKYAQKLVKELEENNIRSSIIGEIREGKEDRNLPRVEQDEIWRFM